MANSKSYTGGISLFSIVTVIFVIAKLTGHFDHSWWLVFLPAIIGVVLGVGILVFIIGLAIVAAVLKD